MIYEMGIWLSWGRKLDKYHPQIDENVKLWLSLVDIVHTFRRYLIVFLNPPKKHVESVPLQRFVMSLLLRWVAGSVFLFLFVSALSGFFVSILEL
jgi:hypothetical protein